MVEGLPSATTVALPRKLSRLTPSSSTNYSPSFSFGLSSVVRRWHFRAASPES